MTTQTMDETKAAEITTPAERTPILWGLTALVGALTGVAWTVILLFAPDTVKIMAGIAPVVGGIYLGRKVKDRAFTHGFLMSLIAVIAAMAIVAPIVFTEVINLSAVDPKTGAVPTIMGTFLSISLMMLITLVPFPIYGVMLSVRNKKRAEEFSKEANTRGGQLQRPGRILNLDDLQALPLPKFSSWVVQLFKDKGGFVLDDYQFGKDVVDLKMHRSDPEEKWLVRCTVADTIKPGMAQELVQDLRESEFAKGVVVTSTTVLDATRKWAKTRRNIDVLDGETLMEMHG